MKSIIFICPYFGKLPIGQMKLWLQSCRMNSTIDWLIITNDQTKELKYPENVKVIYMSFDEFKKYVQSKFEFSIVMKTPYKLCDFKPVYGYIFKEYIFDYEYWGHCDMTDTIFGNLRKFLTVDLLEKSDKVGFLGHMTLYKNVDKINQRFFIEIDTGQPIDKILGSMKNMAFDESMVYGINAIYREKQFPQSRIDNMYVDINALYPNFRAYRYDDHFCGIRDSYIPRIFEWDNGKLYDVHVLNNCLYRNEIGYVHFQKRKMTNNVQNSNRFYIVPNQFIDIQEKLSVEYIKKIGQKSIFYKRYFELRFINLKSKINRYLQINYE